MKPIVAPAVLSVLLLVPAMAGAEELPADAVLVSDLEVAVSVADLESALWGMPATQRRQIERNPSNLESMLDSLYLNRVLAAEAREQGFDQDDIVRLRLQQRREAEVSRLWLRDQDEAPTWEEVERDRDPELNEAALQEWLDGLD